PASCPFLSSYSNRPNCSAISACGLAAWAVRKRSRASSHWNLSVMFLQHSPRAAELLAAVMPPLPAVPLAIWATKRDSPASLAISSQSSASCRVEAAEAPLALQPVPEASAREFSLSRLSISPQNTPLTDVRSKGLRSPMRRLPQHYRR